ncbi:MAG: methyltransferase [Candidatus Sedimenticola sp. 6PFRAG1]
MSVFRFQQFSVLQERSAMRVCTDATLFGAMAPVRGGEQVLDIGAGTGLLALMAAQLGAGLVTAVELTEEACDEARHNFSHSPWSDRLEAVHRDIQGFAAATGNKYDLVISNPPFFDSHSKSPATGRNIARHTDLLPYADLIAATEKLLTREGLFYLLIPLHVVDDFCAKAGTAGLYLVRRTDYRGYAHNMPKVSALTFSREQGDFRSELLTIYREERVYSEESTKYLSPFLLRFAEETR